MALEHKCGVALISDLQGQEGSVVETTVDLLEHLKHRGHDMSGISVAQHGILTTHHGLGTPLEALGNARMLLKGSAAIGHTRYTTNKTKSLDGAHPREFPHADPSMHFSYAFNGQVVPTDEGRKLLASLGHAINPDDDTGMLGMLLAHHMRTRNSMEDALRDTWSHISGAHNGVVLKRNGEAFAWADPMKFHPLIWAQRGDLVAVLSETNPLDEVWEDGQETRGEIPPGAMMRLIPGQKPAIVHVQESVRRAFCPFEPYYFMKGGSQLGEITASRVRIKAGGALAKLDEKDGFLEAHPNLLVTPVPETGKYFAEGYANRAKRGRGDAITRQQNFDKRTFILDGEGLRKKFKFDPDQIRGRDIALVDDSIVKGNTMRFIVQVLREECGPSSIHVRSGFPIVRAPCFYGINMPVIEELWWSTYMTMLYERKNLDDVMRAMAKDIGADSLKFLPTEEVPRTIRGMTRDTLCRGCTEGIYPTKEGQTQYESQLHQILPHA